MEKRGNEDLLLLLLLLLLPLIKEQAQMKEC